MTSFASKAITYYNSLSVPATLPTGIEVMNPYVLPEIQRIVTDFYTKFYSDTKPRVFLLGINPGRFGAGATGISFTTPENLRRYCGIDTNLPNSNELSSRFIYQVVEALGGAKAFYSQFFLTALFPLALTKHGKNYNYYDDRLTTKTLWPAITETVGTQIEFGASRHVAICLGRKNETYLQRLNDQQSFFERIVTLDHPRYILQYRSRDLNIYLERYIQTLGDCL